MVSPYLLKQTLFTTVFQFLFWGGVTFLPAGTLDWPRAWVFIIVAAIAGILTILIAFLGNEGLLKERMKPPIQKDQPLNDKIVLSCLLAAYLVMMVCIPLDVFYWHWLPAPPDWLSYLGLALFAAGWWITGWVFKENAFAAPVVKHQAERGQHVISTGPYAFVRHPMYVGAIFMMLGQPLWLQSTTAALLAFIPILLLALRITQEESFLVRELAGYEAYREKVRFRLCPGIW